MRLFESTLLFSSFLIEMVGEIYFLATSNSRKKEGIKSTVAAALFCCCCCFSMVVS